jgi:signal transduction histidine kinase
MSRLRKRVWNVTTLLGLIASMILSGIVFGAYIFSEKTDQLASSAFEISQAELKLSRMYAALLQAESSQRGFLLIRDEAYLEPYASARQIAQAQFAEFDALVRKFNFSAKQTDRELREALDNKFSELDQTIAFARQGNIDESIAIVRGNRGRELMTKISEVVGGWREALASVRALRFAQMHDSATKLTILTALGVVVVVLLSIIAVRQLFRHGAELHRAQERLEAANLSLDSRVVERTRELQLANDEIQRYAYIVSHDLRSPLVNIIGFAKELETAVRSIVPVFASPHLDRADPVVSRAFRAVEDDIPEALKFIQMSTTRMDNLITAILNLSRLGRLPLQPENLDLKVLTENCMGSIQHRVSEAGASISIEGILPHVIGDRRALEQIIGNLLDNAVKYLSSERRGRIVVRARRDADKILIEVADNGRGVALADQQRIFDLFRRSGKQDRPGEGIGLAHVRSLVRRMGGEIDVKSDGKAGSLFSFTIPFDLRRAISEGLVNE